MPGEKLVLAVFEKGEVVGKENKIDFTFMHIYGSILAHCDDKILKSLLIIHDFFFLRNNHS